MSRSRGSRGVGIAILLVCIGVCGAPCVDADDGPSDDVRANRYELEHTLHEQVNEAIRLGVRYVRRARHPDGSWGRTRFSLRVRPEPDNSPPTEDSWLPGTLSRSGELDTTALCGLVLARHGYREQACVTLRLLEKHFDEVLCDARAAALTLLLAHALEPVSFGKEEALRERLANGQVRMGMWGYSLGPPAVGRLRLDVSYWVAMGLTSSERTDLPSAQVLCLERLRGILTRGGGKGGGLGYNCLSRAPKYYFQGAFMAGDLLAEVDRCLERQSRGKQAGRRARRRIDQTLERFFARIESDVDRCLMWLQTPALQAPPHSLSWPYHTLLVMTRVCHRRASKPIDALEWHRRTAELLVAWQADDGSWPVLAGFGDGCLSPLSRTALALLCLRPALPAKEGPAGAPTTPGR